jgi:tetratricopeptide (TPR) repeat protein
MNSSLDERIKDATLQLALGMRAEGLSALESLVAEHPTSAASHAALAYARLLLGRYDGALEAAGCALACEVAGGEGASAIRIDAHFVAARALGRRAGPGDLAAAARHLEAALEDLGVLAAVLEHREELGLLADTPAFASAVLGALERWVAREPDSEDAWGALAREHLEHRDRAGAKEAAAFAASRLVSLTPRSGAAHYLLACALCVRDGLGDRDSARVHVADAARLDPELHDALAGDADLSVLGDAARRPA